MIRHSPRALELEDGANTRGLNLRLQDHDVMTETLCVYLYQPDTNTDTDTDAKGIETRIGIQQQTVMMMEQG